MCDDVMVIVVIVTLVIVTVVIVAVVIVTVVVVTVVIATVVIEKVFSKNNLNILTTKEIFKGQRFAILTMFLIAGPTKILKFDRAFFLVISWVYIGHILGKY